MTTTHNVPHRATDEILRDTLRKAYLARARLFAEGIRKRGVEDIVNFLSGSDWEKLDWDLEELRVSDSAFKKVERAGVDLQLVFCHPDVITENRKALDYYRNLAALSKKGLNQMLYGLKGSERDSEQIRLINAILSSIVEDMPAFDLALARLVIPAEIGAELQGTWVNIIGRGAAARVEKLINDYVSLKKIARKFQKKSITIRGKRKTQREILLKNSWRIIFADEPDVSIRDSGGTLKVAIEIKGSMDKAGAQTRYGEAKKSFAKALKERAQCETIYLASCYTKAVEEQIEEDAQVRKKFNLIDIMEDHNKQQEFLEELFVHQIRIRTH